MHATVQYRGSQADLFRTGRADRAITLSELPSSPALHALGPCEHLDGEITVLHGKPHVSRVREGGYQVEHGFDHGAIFLVWAQQSAWQDLPVPASVSNYLELQTFVRDAAAGRGIDTSHAFPFLLAGTPVELVWHINVDRTGGQPFTRELFQRSKESYVLRREAVEIVGFYSEQHGGVFISAYAPALRADQGEHNFMHIHFVSRDSRATGHIDDLRLDGMTLRLPA